MVATTSATFTGAYTAGLVHGGESFPKISLNVMSVSQVSSRHLAQATPTWDPMAVSKVDMAVVVVTGTLAAQVNAAFVTADTAVVPFGTAASAEAVQADTAVWAAAWPAGTVVELGVAPMHAVVVVAIL